MDDEWTVAVFKNTAMLFFTENQETVTARFVSPPAELGATFDWL
jgi:hypothetical protein